jgi:hypothetical protein
VRIQNTKEGVEAKGCKLAVRDKLPRLLFGNKVMSLTLSGHSHFRADAFELFDCSGIKFCEPCEREVMSLSAPQLFENGRELFVWPIAVKTLKCGGEGRENRRVFGFSKTGAPNRRAGGSRHDIMRWNATAVIRFLAVSYLRFRFHNQSRLPRRLVPNTFAGV